MTTVHFGTPQYPETQLTPYRSLIRVTQPLVEPVTLRQAKSHCRVDASDSDAYIASLISTAREYVENQLDTTLVTTVWQARYDGFPLWPLLLPRPPMAAANVTVTYKDVAASTQTITSAGNDFLVDEKAIPGRILPQYNGNWPVPRGDEGCVTVQWTAGYGDSGESTPHTIKHIILLLVGHWFSSREPVAPGAMNPVPLTVETLMAHAGWGGYR